MNRFALIAVFTALVSNASAQSMFVAQTIAGSDDVRDGGPATAALIAHVEGVAVDAAGNLYIGDADGHRIRKIMPGGFISTIAGTGHAGFAGDGGPASAASINTPYGVVADRSGNVIFADLGNARIRRINRDGSIVTIAGGGVSPGGQSDGRLATDVRLNAPRNVAADSSGNVFFSDFADHRVYQINANGILLRAAGNGQAGFSGDGGPALFGQLNSPAGLALDASGNLYIADSANSRIRKLSRGVLSSVGTPSTVPLSTPTGLTIDGDGSLIVADPGNGQLLRITPLLQSKAIAILARDVAIDAAGNLYTASGAYVYRRSISGAITLAAGSGAFAFAGDSSFAVRARLNSPSGIARDVTGNIYVADSDNNRVRKISPDGVIVTIAGTGVAGAMGDGGFGVAAQLNHPMAVAADNGGNLYIADTGNHRVRRLDASGRLFTIAGIGERGFGGDNVVAVRARLDTPGSLALDAGGNLYVAETGSHVIRRISTGGILTTVAGTGIRGFIGDGGTAVAASLDSPRSIAIDKNGVLFIADTGNHRIRRVSPNGPFGPGLISTFPESDAAIWRLPWGIAVDDSGSVYLSDAQDQRVFRVESTGRISTIAGDGLQGFTGETAVGLSTRLDTPLGIAIDATGALLIADSGNNRIRQLTPSVDLVTPPTSTSDIAIMNAASLRPGPIAVGEIVSIFGEGLGPIVAAAAPAAIGGSIPRELAGVQVLFNGHAAALFFVQQNQINLQVPYSINGAQFAEIQVLVNGVLRSKTTAGVADATPAIFANSNGAAVVVNEDGTLNAPDNPAARGSVVTMYATGEGQVLPQPSDGQIAGYPSPTPVLPVSLRIGDYGAELLYAQSAPGFAGLMQINARVPGGFAPPGILPVVLQAGSAESPPVTIAVK